MPSTDLRQALAKSALFAFLALFLLPGISWGLARHFRADADATMTQAVNAYVDQASDIRRDEGQQIRDFFAANPPSATCSGLVPPVGPEEGFCATWSPLWQFHWAERVAGLTVVGGAVLMALMVGLGGLAFARRRWQLLSFVAGWRMLVAASALTLLLQGAFAVWLSFWITAFFFDIYIPKLILIVAIVVAAAVFAAIKAILTRAKIDDRVAGERIAPDAAPALWARLREFAARLGTAPPDEVVAGIDANFFVTEQPLRVGDTSTRGRALYVSLPLLRVLAQDEADAVLAHELGHFVGGDTSASAELGPRLVQFDHYLEQMRVGGLTVIGFLVLDLYRLIFELALRRSSREREFAADRVAAELVSPDALARALVKVSAYALYRGEVENKLFVHDERHDAQLGIGQRVAGGLAEFSRSAAFVDGVRARGVPHPFDSHPPLRERIGSVGADLPEGRFADIVCEPPALTWIAAIAPAAEIEGRLWAEFEQAFAQAHEQSLAYRYEPADDTERALVEKYFPPVHFALKKGGRLEINHGGLVLVDPAGPLPFDAVKSLAYEDNSLGADQLTVGHPDKGWNGRKSSKLAIAIAAGDRERFKETLGRYWHRHQAMRDYQRR
jgi:Zn-dependent protease with chaperone function